MPRNGSGGYSLPEPPFVTGTIIDPSPVNNDFNDIAQALTGSVASDGQTPMTGDLKMGGNNILNVASIATTALAVSGAFTAGSVGATGAVTAGGNSTFDKKVSIGDTLTVSNGATIGGNVAVGGTSIFDKSVTMGAALTVSGNLAIGGTSTFDKSVTMGNALTITNGLTVGTTITATGVVSGANGTSGSQLVAYQQFPGSLSTNGYSKLPNGVTEQWGEALIVGSATVNFPVAFSSACVGVWIQNETAGSVVTTVLARSTTQATVAVADSTTGAPTTATVNYLAKGY